MRTISFIAAVLISAAFLSNSVDNTAMAVAFARPEPAQFRTFREIDNGMKRRTLYKRAPQRSGGKNDDQNQGKDDNNGGKSGGKDAGSGGSKSGNRSGTDRNGGRPNNNGKEDGGKAKNDGNDESNAKNSTSDNGTEEDTNSGANGTAADDAVTNGATANETDASGEEDSSNSTLYNNGPSSVNTKGAQNGTVIAAVAVSAILIVGASLIVFMRRKKDVQTEAIIEKSATAFAQQNSEYATLEDDTPPPVGSFKVISTFVPNLADELDVDLGDTVTVLVEYDDGWVQGINESRSGAKGVMPRHCLNMSSKYSMNKRSSSIGFSNVNLG